MRQRGGQLSEVLHGADGMEKGLGQGHRHLRQGILGPVERGVDGVPAQAQLGQGRALRAPQGLGDGVEDTHAREVEVAHREASHLPLAPFQLQGAQTLKGCASEGCHQVAVRAHQHEPPEALGAPLQLGVLHALAALQHLAQQPGQHPARGEAPGGDGRLGQSPQQLTRLPQVERRARRVPGLLCEATGLLHHLEGVLRRLGKATSASFDFLGCRSVHGPLSARVVAQGGGARVEADTAQQAAA